MAHAIFKKNCFQVPDLTPDYGKWEIKTNTITGCCPSLSTTRIGKDK
jgi:hypothetical protein